jgi:threonyl-tRNA synthetase
MISIQLPDGSRRQFEHPVTVAEVAASIGPGLAKAALAGRIGEGPQSRLVDTSHRLDGDTKLAIVTDKDPDGLEVVRHSTAHLLAYAVKELFPDAQVTIGLLLRLLVQAALHARGPAGHRGQDGRTGKERRAGDARGDGAR